MGGEIPHELALRLKEHGKVDTFVETGTYKGRTALWAAEHFGYVITIERSVDLWTKFRDIKPINVHSMLGDSALLMPEIIVRCLIRPKSKPYLFWLDAHYSGGDTAGADAECPLMLELDTIVRSDQLHYILMDDATMFAGWVENMYVNVPPPPHNPSHWPAYDWIKNTLEGRGYFVKIVGDVIVAVPPAAADLVY